MSVGINRYLEYRKQLALRAPRVRTYCENCVRPTLHCFCAHIHPFDPKIQFAILIHPIELKRRIATGRMAHLSLQGSHFIVGDNYSDRLEVNLLIENPNNHCVILYPGENSILLDFLTDEAHAVAFPKDKNLVVFVIDGTWHTARRTLRDSENLKILPAISFTPGEPSHFRVRKQPSPECYSTVEAIHHTIELLGSRMGFDVASRKHDHLLNAFDWMVEKQIASFKSAPLLRRPR